MKEYINAIIFACAITEEHYLLMLICHCIKKENKWKKKEKMNKMKTRIKIFFNKEVFYIKTKMARYFQNGKESWDSCVHYEVLSKLHKVKD